MISDLVNSIIAKKTEYAAVKSAVVWAPTLQAIENFLVANKAAFIDVGNVIKFQSFTFNTSTRGWGGIPPALDQLDELTNQINQYAVARLQLLQRQIDEKNTVYDWTRPSP